MAAAWRSGVEAAATQPSRRSRFPRPCRRQQLSSQLDQVEVAIQRKLIEENANKVAAEAKGVSVTHGMGRCCSLPRTPLGGSKRTRRGRIARTPRTHPCNHVGGRLVGGGNGSAALVG